MLFARMDDRFCDSCNAPLAGDPALCSIAVAGKRVVLGFELCPVCQAELLLNLRQFLVYHPPRRLAA